LNTQYSTAGLCGINEACELMGLDILTEDGQAFVRILLDTVNKVNDEYAKKYKAPHNCEQTPSENSAIKMATKDRLLGYNTKYELYSNQFIPLTTKANMLDRVRLQGLFDGYMSGGAICHVNVETQISDWHRIADMIRMCAKMGVVYWAINYNLQRCEDGHMTVGKGETCSICGKPITDNFTRPVGFLTPVKNWHYVRRELEYPKRQFYSEGDIHSEHNLLSV
jgi:ribonucleoside-triphosphate reductase